MTKIIGLTGGIGSGKTTVAAEFQKRGVPVYIADDEAKKILDLPETKILVQSLFGNEIIIENKVSRQKLAEIVFNNPEKLQQLNTIIHPLVKQHFSGWLQQYQHKPFVIRETAILFESGSYKDCYKIITVTAPLEIRIKRVMERDSVTHDSVLKRINNQWTDEQRIAKSDYIILNISSEDTKNQISKVYTELTNL